MGLAPDRSITIGKEVYVADAGGGMRKGREQGNHFGMPHDGSHGPVVLETVDNLKGVFGYVVRSVLVPSCAPCVEIYGENNVAGLFNGLNEPCIMIEIGLRCFQQF